MKFMIIITIFETIIQCDDDIIINDEGMNKRNKLIVEEVNKELNLTVDAITENLFSAKNNTDKFPKMESDIFNKSKNNGTKNSNEKNTTTMMMMTMINNNIKELENDKINLNLNIENKLEDSCYIKVISQYLQNKDKNEINFYWKFELEKFTRDEIMKIISIEMTKCLFGNKPSNNERIIQISKECYFSHLIFKNDYQYDYAYDYEYENYQLIKDNIEDCIISMSSNIIIWTSFTSYMSRVDDIIEKNLNKLENLKIVEEYGNIITKLSKHLNEMIENERFKFEKDIERDNENFEKMRQYENELKLKFEEEMLVIKKEIGKIIQVDEIKREDNQDHKYHKDHKDRKRHLNLKTLISVGIGAVIFIWIAGLFLTGAISPRNAYSTLEKDGKTHVPRGRAVEQAVLERVVAFVAGIGCVAVAHHAIVGVADVADVADRLPKGEALANG